MNHKFNELDWIDFLKKKTPKSREVLTGIGDDCALVKTPGKNILLKSDLFIEGVHFRKKNSKLSIIALRAVSRVLSDFAACAGLPKFIGISIGIPKYLKPRQLKEILNEIISLGRKYGFSLVGGDTACSSKLFFDVWGVGLSDKFISRGSAKIGDYIFLTGKLGRNKFNEKFTPRIKESQYLVSNFKINSMIDISDGFILDLYRLLKESKKGALIHKNNVPVTHGKNDFYRGEDYELIFTVDKNEKRLNLLKSKFYFIGTIESSKFGYKIDENNKLSEISITGYTHF